MLYAIFRSVGVSVWSFVGGTAIDLDHLYDYAIYSFNHPREPRSLKNFFYVLSNSKLEKVYVLLHSWELVAVILLAGWYLPAVGDVLIPLAFGMAVHILFDAIFNPAAIASYSLTLRCAGRFKGDFFYCR